MFVYFAGLVTFLKMGTPYIRKHVLNTLESYEYLMINVAVIFLIISVILLFHICFDKGTHFYRALKNYQKLSWSQIISIFVLASLTVCTSVLMFEMDKKYNTPMLNAVFMRAISIIALTTISIFVFREQYSLMQMVGVGFIVFGIYLVHSYKL